MLYDERPDAGNEWIAKAMLLGAELQIDISVWGRLWGVRLPGGEMYFGVTQARACRKLVRAVLGAGL